MVDPGGNVVLDVPDDLGDDVCAIGRAGWARTGGWAGTVVVGGLSLAGGGIGGTLRAGAGGWVGVGGFP